MTTPELTLGTLSAAVKGATAIRSRVRMQPVAGEGTAVMPPTYEGGKYAVGKAKVNGEEVETVALDSVASQANRSEEALLAAHELGAAEPTGDEMDFPVPYIDLADTEVAQDGRLTALEASHRLFDGYFRDSELPDGTPFEQTELWKEIDAGGKADVSAIFRHCPHSLVFGYWDSTGRRFGLGAKSERLYTSRIDGFDVSRVPGSNSKIDPFGIQIGVGPIYAPADKNGPAWTDDKDKAWRGKDGKSEPKELNPSDVNHGNVTPSLVKEGTNSEHPGGVRMAYAEQVFDLSMAGLRKLRFGQAGAQAADAARTALAALGVAAFVLQQETGHHLRSGCDLVPEDWPQIEVVGKCLADVKTVTVTPDDAKRLVREAAAAAEKAGLGWSREHLRFVPSAHLRKILADNDQRQSENRWLTLTGQKKG